MVLTDHMPWGHRAIAKAIYGFLKINADREGWEVNYAEVKIPYSIINDVYVLMYRFLPLSNRITNKLMKKDNIRRLFLELLEYDGSVGIKKIINNYQPDLVISSYFLHTHALVKLRKELTHKYMIYTIVTDPWTMNPLAFVPEADKSFVYDEIGVKEGLKYGVEKQRLVQTGWWVRSEMYNEELKTQTSKLKIRNELGFTDDRKVVFIGGGSLGTNAMLKFLPVLLLVKRKVGVVFNTGTDELAYNTVEQYAKLLKRLKRNSLVQIKNLGWIDNMAEVLSICDIVFGKAGPNFLFDVVAMGKPFVSITHVGGQEDGNIELIRKKGLGWVREKGNSAVEFLLKYLDDPEKYENKYKVPIEVEARRNRGSLEKIVEIIKKDME